MKNMKIDANGTEIRLMGDVINENAYICPGLGDAGDRIFGTK